jgi:hypothetical protein
MEETDVKEIRYEGIMWIQLAQYRIQWRALMNTITNLSDRGISQPAE